MATRPLELRGQLPAPQAVELMLDSMFGYPNPLVAGSNGNSSVPNIFRRLLADYKGQYKTMIVGEGADVFQPVDSVCEQGTTIGPKPTRTVTIQPQLYKSRGSFCVSEIKDLCNTYNGSAMQKALQPLETGDNELVDVILAQALRDNSSAFGEIVWFSKKGIAVDTAGSAAPFYIANLTASKQTMLGKIDGFWARLEALAGTDIPYVDLNNGVAKGAINPDAVASYLRKMIDSASDELVNATGAEKPFFLVDDAIFRALKKYREFHGAGSEGAWNSVQMEYANGIMSFEGYAVYRDSAASKFDTIAGAKTTSSITSTSYGVESIKHSRNLRAVFMSPQMMGFASDLNTPAGYGQEGTGVYVWTGSHETADEGRLKWVSYLTAGVEVLDPKMFVVGYPSNATTFV